MCWSCRNHVFCMMLNAYSFCKNTNNNSNCQAILIISERKMLYFTLMSLVWRNSSSVTRFNKGKGTILYHTLKRFVSRAEQTVSACETVSRNVLC